MLLKGFWKILIPLRNNGPFRFFSLCDGRKTTKSADFGLFFDFACFQASFDVFCMRWGISNIILEVQRMRSETLQARIHSNFHLLRPFGRQKSQTYLRPASQNVVLVRRNWGSRNQSFGPIISKGNQKFSKSFLHLCQLECKLTLDQLVKTWTWWGETLIFVFFCWSQGVAKSVQLGHHTKKNTKQDLAQNLRVVGR